MRAEQTHWRSRKHRRGRKWRFDDEFQGFVHDAEGGVVGPKLKLQECGLPKNMALELFKPHMIRELMSRGYSQTPRSAKLMIENHEPVVYKVLEYVVTFQNLLVDAKMLIVKKLNSVKGLTDTFIKTSNGFKVTNPEGYVAIDRVSGGAVKLVDRMPQKLQG